MSDAKNIIVLGATGSIGQQTLDVVRQHPDKLNVVGLVAYSSKDKLTSAAQEFGVKNCVLVKDEPSENEATKKVLDLIHGDNVDIVVNAMSGAVGLEASYETLLAGKRLALANKESLVVGGDLIMPLAKNIKEQSNEDKLLPIDSEHGAIYQCLIGEKNSEIFKIHLTASGGPFYGKLTDDLKNITASEALKHPT